MAMNRKARIAANTRLQQAQQEENDVLARARAALDKASKSAAVTVANKAPIVGEVDGTKFVAHERREGRSYVVDPSLGDVRQRLVSDVIVFHVMKR